MSLLIKKEIWLKRVSFAYLSFLQAAVSKPEKLDRWYEVGPIQHAEGNVQKTGKARKKEERKKPEEK